MNRSWYRVLVFPAVALLVATAGCAKRQYIEQTAYPNPYDSSFEFIRGIYKADHATGSLVMRNATAAIVPHHLVASESDALGLRALSGSVIRRIILLSPDHFHQCPTILCTVNGRFETFFGDITADPQIIEQLSQSPLVTIDPPLFIREHGIYAVLPFIAHYRPGIPVIPITLSQKIPWKGHAETIHQLIGSIMDDSTAVIVSSDFSHYLSLQKADLMDAKTERALLDQDLPALMQLNNSDQSDCPDCLWTITAIAKDHGWKPRILLHTNSALLLGDATAPSTTSHYAVGFVPAK